MTDEPRDIYVVVPFAGELIVPLEVTSTDDDEIWQAALDALEQADPRIEMSSTEPGVEVIFFTRVSKGITVNFFLK